jgi:hypothetical protein
MAMDSFMTVCELNATEHNLGDSLFKLDGKLAIISPKSDHFSKGIYGCSFMH